MLCFGVRFHAHRHAYFLVPPGNGLFSYCRPIWNRDSLKSRQVLTEIPRFGDMYYNFSIIRHFSK